jgi:hypothetical protein
MKINLRNYEIQRIDGQLQKIELRESKLKRYFKLGVLKVFKTINYRHMNLTESNDKPVIKEILDIRGIKTCAYEGSGGQVVIAEFMWKFGKYYI